ncbi:stAR-related lipid transfer protein 7, mitochondrial isoform X2 [Leptopilina boulardi]|uniref:stAR-related lipid transfer protein 7, mitochondrial isoform X2 n=1 Tax=Leptopilina boulardi TaxID=63433 RepID=UPI0021F5A7A1|nr:stAR-related lipid transfer protein 7, mitochondrial isoform X2 [Leptopilina boulardi]
MFAVHISNILMRSSPSHLSRAVYIRTPFDSLYFGHCRSFKRQVAGRPWNYGKLNKCCSQRINSWITEQGFKIICTCIKQLEFMAAQRIERSVQVFQFYIRLWDKVILKELIKFWRKKSFHKNKTYLLSTIGIVAYNWDKERITNEEMESYTQEIDEIYKLRTSTVICSQCHKRLIIDTVQNGVDYCNCYGINQAKAINKEDESWEPFIEREDMLIWRRLDSNSGLYAYKVYGSFSDVTAADFLQVQLDIEYRKKWDKTAKELDIIDTDPLTESTENCRSDIVYWEMMWPRLFANRDYVYQRKWMHNKEKDTVVIASKATEHPKAPNRTDTYRVKSYWSFMVIKPYKDINDFGIEFGLTYFDDPGMNIPSAVTSWVAMSGLPDYLCRMREATRNYKKYKENREKLLTSVVDKQTCDKVILNEQSSNEESKSNKLDNTQLEIISSKYEIPFSSHIKNVLDVQEKEKTNEIDNFHEEDEGFLNYFFFTRLFA